MKLLNLEGASAETVEQAEAELHKTFATLTQEEQKYANIFSTIFSEEMYRYLKEKL